MRGALFFDLPSIPTKRPTVALHLPYAQVWSKVESRRAGV